MKNYFNIFPYVTLWFSFHCQRNYCNDKVMNLFLIMQYITCEESIRVLSYFFWFSLICFVFAKQIALKLCIRANSQFVVQLTLCLSGVNWEIKLVLLFLNTHYWAKFIKIFMIWMLQINLQLYPLPFKFELVSFVPK